MLSRRAYSLLLAAIAPAACRSSSDAGGAPAAVATAGANAAGTVIDSAGMACTTLITPGDSLPPRFGMMAVGPNGMLAWEPAGKSMLVIRSADGSEARVSGASRDEGFYAARAMGWRGDTLWILDQNSTRIQRFGPDGHWRGSVTSPDFTTWIPSDDGRLRAIAPFGITASVPDSTRALIVTVPRSRHVDTLVQIPSPPITLLRGKLGAFASPLGEFTVAGGSADASRWCGAIPATGGIDFRCFDAGGKAVVTRQIPIPRRAMTDEIYHMVVAASMRTGQRDITELEAMIPRPDSLPYVFQVLMGHDGAAWLLRSAPSEPEQQWLRLDREGAPRGEVHLPRRFAVREVSGDSLWIAESDAAGMQKLTRCLVHQ